MEIPEEIMINLILVDFVVQIHQGHDSKLE